MRYVSHKTFDVLHILGVYSSYFMLILNIFYRLLEQGGVPIKAKEEAINDKIIEFSDECFFTEDTKSFVYVNNRLGKVVVVDTTDKVRKKTVSDLVVNPSKDELKKIKNT